jgi:4-hydroxy-tetrahydrodipicolinate reductase
MALNIALLGYGKMGKAVEAIAIERGHHIVATIGREGIASHAMENVDCVIEFSRPEAALDNMQSCMENNLKMVIGTTGWHDHESKVNAWVQAHEGTLVHASNFSLGVNLFFKLNAQLAQWMSPFEAYTPQVSECHHTDKLDQPSGTAISLAQGILPTYPKLEGWSLEASDNQLSIDATRVPDVPGTHEVHYRSKQDSLSIKHEAHSREGFALGAVIAAEMAQDLHGMHRFSDLLFPQ